MIRATLCTASLVTMLVALLHGMLGGSPWPLLASALLCVFGLPRLVHQRHAPFQPRRN